MTRKIRSVPLQQVIQCTFREPILHESPQRAVAIGWIVPSRHARRRRPIGCRKGIVENRLGLIGREQLSGYRDRVRGLAEAAFRGWVARGKAVTDMQRDAL